MFRRSRTVLVLAVVLLVMASMGAGAVMAKSLLHPISEDGIINGAYQKENGMLRLVNGPEDVKPSEVFIQWNQQGPPGPPGGIDEASEQEIKDGICAICETLNLVDETPGFCFALKQQRTMELIHYGIYLGNRAYQKEETQEFAPSLDVLLHGGFINTVHLYDGWGNPFLYNRDTPLSYTVVSLGYDGESGPDPPDPWLLGESGESDIIFKATESTSGFLQAPGE